MKSETLRYKKKLLVYLYSLSQMELRPMYDTIIKKIEKLKEEVK